MSNERAARRDTLRQKLLLGPGVGVAGVGVISLFRDPAAAVAWIVLAVGLVLLLFYLRSLLRGRAR